MNIKRVVSVTEQFGIDWECTIEFDLDALVGESQVALLEALQESLDFFTCGKDLLNDCGGDIIAAYTKMVSHKIMSESMKWNITGVIGSFKDAEGLLPLDGSWGVKLVRCDEFEIEEEFSVKYVE